MIDGRYAASILDVRILRDANMDPYHFLVAAKVRTRLCAGNNTCKSVQPKLVVQKLRAQNIAESFSTRLSEVLLDAPPDTDVSTLLTPCTLQLGKRLDAANSESQHGSAKN